MCPMNKVVLENSLLADCKTLGIASVIMLMIKKSFHGTMDALIRKLGLCSN